MENLAIIIGERIRNIRKERGLSQEELAHRAMLHPTYIGQVERGEKNLTLESLEKITSALDITLEETFRYIQPSSEKEDIIYQIIALVRNLTPAEQREILRFIDMLLEWREK